MQITLYSYLNTNTSTIAYPKNQGYPTVHSAAGGTGTFADPLTVGSEKTEFAPGTMFYIPFLKKYGVMEDACPNCTTLWQAKTYAIRVWIGGNSTYTLPDMQELSSCETALTQILTQSSVYSPVDVSPASSYTINTAAIFNLPDPAVTGTTESTCTNASS